MDLRQTISKNLLKLKAGINIADARQGCPFMGDAAFQFAADLLFSTFTILGINSENTNKAT